MTVGPIPSAEIESWARLRGFEISPAEAVLIDRLDTEYRRAIMPPKEEEEAPGDFLRNLKKSHDAAKGKR